MNPNDIAKLITEDPDIIEEALCKCGMPLSPQNTIDKSIFDPHTRTTKSLKVCGMCGRKVSAQPVPHAQQQTPISTPVSCPMAARDFNWKQFNSDVEAENQELSMDDFDPDSNYVTKTVLAYSTKPLPNIDHIIDEFHNNPSYIEDTYPAFYNSLKESVSNSFGKNDFWEYETGTQPNYHGRFKSIYFLVELNDIDLEEIEEIEQDDDGIVILHLGVSVPYSTKGWQADSLL